MNSNIYNNTRKYFFPFVYFMIYLYCFLTIWAGQDALLTLPRQKGANGINLPPRTWLISLKDGVILEGLPSVSLDDRLDIKATAQLDQCQ